MGNRATLASQWHEIVNKDGLDAALVRIRGEAATASQEQLSEVTAALRYLGEWRLSEDPDIQRSLVSHLHRQENPELQATTDGLEQSEKSLVELRDSERTEQQAQEVLRELLSQRDELAQIRDKLLKTRNELREQLKTMDREGPRPQNGHEERDRTDDADPDSTVGFRPEGPDVE